jgi:hypothetical protein
MHLPIYQLVRGDDWEGLYIDGKLETEGHSLSPSDIFKVLDIRVTNHDLDDEWICEQGSLPENFDEVKLA